MTVTLGVEEELQVVDAASGALVPHDSEKTRRILAGGAGGIDCEIHKCVIELQTPVTAHPDAAIRSLSILRAVARKLVEPESQKLAAAGLHPFSSWQTQPLHDDPVKYPHYAHLLREYGDIARSAMSFGLHVHLGLPNPELRMPVMNALRSVLPEVMALSANSPFHDGRDTGLASWRHSVLGRYPRMGIPEIWPDEESYFGHIERLRRLGSVEPGKGMWDDLRLHLLYGTIEIRICDQVYSLERAWLIVALLQCETMILIEEAASGKLKEPERAIYIEENKWRARRQGMNAALIDWRRDETVHTALRYERWLARLEPVAVELGIWPRLEHAFDKVLAEGNGADAQRLWRDETGSFKGLIGRLVDATAEPWIAPSNFGRSRRETVEHVVGHWAPSSADIRTGETPPRAA